MDEIETKIDDIERRMVTKPIVKEDNKVKETIKKDITKEGQTYEEHIEGCSICESTNPTKPKEN